MLAWQGRLLVPWPRLGKEHTLTTSWSEDERHVEQTWNPPTAWIQAQPNLLDQPTPNQSAQARDKINIFLSQWVGVGSMQHYRDNSWLKEQSDGRNIAEDYTNHIDTNSSSNILFPHQFPINVFKNIWVALFFTSALRHCLPVRDEDSPYQM